MRSAFFFPKENAPKSAQTGPNHRLDGCGRLCIRGSRVLYCSKRKGEKQMESAALIVEGGGMRGVYAAGVMDFFLDKKLCFAAAYGVSAGAGHLCSFLSGQRGRAVAINLDYLGDKRYCSLHSLIRTGDLFGADMLYNIIPNQLNLYDYAAFAANPTRFFAAVTN